MTKKEMQLKLDDWDIKFNPLLNYKETKKLYDFEKDLHNNDEFGLTHIDHEPDPPEDLTERQKLEFEIKKFMGTLKGRTRGKHAEINHMFVLYNQYFNRADSSSCSSCVGRIFNKMMNLADRL